MAKQEKSSAELYREERKKRLAKAAKKNSKKSISSQSAKIAGKVITIIIVIAIIASIGAVVLNQAGVIERSKTAFTVDGQKISQTEYTYYYMSAYNNTAQMAQYYSYYGYSYNFDTSTAPSEQAYSEELEGFEGENPTWADYFALYAKNRIEYIYQCKYLAKEAGIELTEDNYKEVDDAIAELKSSLESNSSNYSVSAYLKASYGKGMNEKLYRQYLEDAEIAELYQSTKTDEYSAEIVKDTKAINKEYKNSISEYGTISVKYFTLTAETKEDDEGNSTVVKKSLKNMKAAAAEIGKATSEKEFTALVKEAKKTYSNLKSAEITDSTDASYSTTTGLASDENYTKWVTNAKATVGSTYVYSDDTQAIVFLMVEPVHHAPDTITYDSRHILIKFADETTETADTEETTDENEVADSEDTETTEAAEAEEVEVPALDTSKADDVTVDNKVDGETAQNKTSYAKIQDVLQEYLDGEHTAEAFAALAEKYSEDTGSNENGGLYEGTELGNFVAPYESWCMQDGRKEGDVGIVEYADEGGSYKGYHLIYYVGQSATSWQQTIANDLASAQYQEEAENFAETTEISVENLNDKVVANAVSFVDKLVKTNARNSSSSSSY